MASQSIIELLGFDPDELDADGKKAFAVIQKLIEAKDKLQQSVASPVSATGLTQFNESLETSAALVSEVNDGLKALEAQKKKTFADDAKIAKQRKDEMNLHRQQMKEESDLQKAAIQEAVQLAKIRADMRKRLAQQELDSLKLVAQQERKNAANSIEERRQVVAAYRAEIELKSQLLRESKLAEQESLKELNTFAQLNTLLKEQELIYKNLILEKGLYAKETIEAGLAVRETANAINVANKAAEKQTETLGNLGKTLTAGLSGIRSLAYILPGLGIAGIFNLAFEGIGNLWDAIMEGSGVTKEGKESNEKYANSIKEIGVNATQAMDDEKARLDVLVGVARDETASKKTRLNAVNEIQKTYPSYFKNLKDEQIMYGNITKELNGLNSALLAKSSAQAYERRVSEASDRLADLNEKLIPAQAELLKAQTEYNYQLKNGVGQQGISSSGAILSNENVIDAKKAVDEIKGFIYEADADRVNYLNKAINFGKQAGDLYIAPETLKKAKDNSKDIAKFAEEEAEARLRIGELVAKFIIEQNDKIIANENISAKTRLAILFQNTEIEKGIIEDRRDFDLKYTKGGESTKKFIIENANYEILASQQKALTESTNITKQEYATKLEIIEDFEKSKKQIMEDAAKREQTVQDTINQLGDDTNSYFNRKRKNNEDKAKEDKKIQDKINENIKKAQQELFDFAKSLTDQRYANEEEKIQRNIQLIDEQKAHELDSIQKSTLSAKDKFAYETQITAQKREADKQAEKEIRKLKHDNAVIDRDIAIAGVIQGTSVGVVNALKIPPPFGEQLAATIAILGAIQLAKVSTTKIPAYAEGGVHPLSGPALFAENNPEWVKEPYKKPYLALKPTIGIMPKGTEFVPTYGAASISERRSNDSWEQTKFLAAQFKKGNKDIKNTIVTKVNIDFGFELYKKSVINNG